MHTKSKKLWKRDKKCVCVCLDFYTVLVLGIWFFWVCFFSVLSLYTKSVRLICIICILKLFRFLFLLTGLLISFCDFVRSLFAQTLHQTEIPRPQINAPRCGTKSPSRSLSLPISLTRCLRLSRAVSRLFRRIINYYQILSPTKDAGDPGQMREAAHPIEHNE